MTPCEIQGTWRHSAASYGALHPIEVLELQILVPRHGVPLTRNDTNPKTNGVFFFLEMGPMLRGMKLDANVWSF